MDARLHQLQGKAEQLTRVAIALGSNLGDRRAHLRWAILRLGDHVSGLDVSPIFETEPEGVTEPQPSYLNAVGVGWTTLNPRQLLERMLQLELARRRERLGFRSPRTLDLDIILFGDVVLSEEGLEIPHPRFRERRFVVEPLAAVAPDMVDPVTGLSAEELLRRLEG